MEYIKHCFHDPAELIDGVHALFEQWEADGTFEPPFDALSLQRLKLAVHEWLANLVQHARFDERLPTVTLQLAADGDSVHCIIEDNSEGFDLDGQLTARHGIFEALPERGMGLLMIKTCTENLSYKQLGPALHCLEFSISADQDPWLNIPF